MTLAIALQWGLLVSYTALLLCAAVAGLRIQRVRPLAFAVGFLSFTHIIYYVLFLILSAVLDAPETQTFSIILRYQVLFTAAFLLAISVKGKRWRD